MSEVASHHTEVMVEDNVIGAGGGESKEDVGIHPPHKPFSDMFLMNTIFL